MSLDSGLCKCDLHRQTNRTENFMSRAAAEVLQPIIAKPGTPPISAVGTSLVVREWTMSGPDWMHVHESDDEAWHVLEGMIRFKFLDREVDATPGTTVFVPAGLAHTYQAIEPSRYLIILTPKIDRLIERLLDPTEVSDLRTTLGEFDTVMVDRPANDGADIHTPQHGGLDAVDV
ncbi:MAG: cupin domain-containing protein [Mesorhizobium sp.]|nr:MAG: cupin domain-containing protein [Mesorhizobium sp.]TIO21043.1 MAG: cupin domain-containing protein [Mesorhizobium sp.]TJV54553.1 MAG: cupin domain-containing protein [Mesorhizobium sp.]